MLKLRLGAEVDMSPETFVWDRDTDIKIVGVPISKSITRYAMRKAGVTHDGTGIGVVSATYDTQVELCLASFKSFEGLEDPDGKPLKVRRDTIEALINHDDGNDLLADAVVFFKELYDDRRSEREDAEGN